MQQQTDCGCAANTKRHADKAAVWGSHGTRLRKRERAAVGRGCRSSRCLNWINLTNFRGAATQAVRPMARILPAWSRGCAARAGGPAGVCMLGRSHAAESRSCRRVWLISVCRARGRGQVQRTESPGSAAWRGGGGAGGGRPSGQFGSCAHLLGLFVGNTPV